MPDINLLKNTEKYDPQAPKPTPPVGPGPLSNPDLEPKGIGRAFRSLFNRRPKPVEPIMPTLGKATGSAGRMSLGKAGGNDRILNEKKSKPTMIQLPEEDTAGFNVNLLGQDSGQKLTLRKQLMKLGVIAVLAVGLVGVVYVGPVYYNSTILTDIDETNEQIAALRRDVTKLEETQTTVAATTKKITAIRSLIDRHVHWSKFFAQLEKVTGPDVFYGSTFSGALSGTVALAARAPTFDAVATQYLFYQQAVARGGFIQSFDITGAVARQTKTGSEVNFTVDMKIDPSVFYVSLDEAKAAATSAIPTTVGNDLVLLRCLLKEDSSLIQYFHPDLRSDVTDGLDTLLCNTVGESDRTRLTNEMKLDADQDGVNALLERLTGLNDQLADTDGDGITDLTDPE